MARIIWLGSYPKSGNTWMRFLLANLYFERVDSSAELSSMIPDIHDSINAGHLYGDEVTFVKTHWKFDPGMPLREDAIAAIYIVRHPLQVIVSNLNYKILRAGEEYFNVSEQEKTALRENYIDNFIRIGGDPQWLEPGMGTLLANYQSWTGDGPGYPVHIIRYEDMKADTAGVLSRLTEFLKLPVPQEKMETAIAASSFDALRNMEEREIADASPSLFFNGGYTTAQSRGRRFMNEGKTKSYPDIMTPEQIAAATERFRPILEDAGYPVPDSGSGTGQLRAPSSITA